MLGPDCYSNPPILNASAGAGHVHVLAGLHCYLSGSPSALLAVILVSDIYGYQTPNLRKIADKVADAGYLAVVPDFFHGEPYNPNNPQRPKDVWLKDHAPEKGFDDAKPLIEALKSKGVSSIGVAGFCWGAKTAVELAKSELTQAAMILHPSYVTLEDIKGVHIPFSILGAGLDKAYPPTLLKQFEQVLTANGVDNYVKVFPNVKHGWTLRYNNSDAEAVKAAEEAHQDLVHWFVKHIK